MRMRTTVGLAALLAVTLWVAPAEAKIVYVKNSGTVEPVVFVAKDRGKDPRRLGIGTAPTIAPNGNWVAFVSVPSGARHLETVVLQKLAGGSQRLVMRSESIVSLRFSPDSSKLAAVAAGKRVRVYDIAADELHVAAQGEIRGYSFSPDSEKIVYGKAENEGFQSASDLFTVSALGGKEKRLTDTGRALNPVWGPDEVFFDRFKRRRGDAPAYNLSAVDPAAPDKLRRLTSFTIPALVSGLVPLETSANSRRMLAVFTGQDAEAGFTVQTRTGKTRQLSPGEFESGIVGFDISRDGEEILAHTGGPDPGAAHDVIVVPYKGGKPRVIVEDAAYPDWTH
jgi:hypothetical protein